LGNLVVVIPTLEPKHRVANRNSSGENSQAFITSCCRDYKIPESLRGLQPFVRCLKRSK
jgi:hypothetical protein